MTCKIPNSWQNSEQSEISVSFYSQVYYMYYTSAGTENIGMR